jgi:hypothetical protein
MFKCFDVDSPTQYNYIGESQTTVSQIVGSKNSTIVLNLMNKQENCGRIIIRAEKTDNNTDLIHMKFALLNGKDN